MTEQLTVFLFFLYVDIVALIILFGFIHFYVYVSNSACRGKKKKLTIILVVAILKVILIFYVFW